MNNDRTKILKSTIKVRFQHCDPLGHLNNSAYIDYFLNAREDQLMEYYHIDTYDYAMTQHKAWVVASHSINYHVPLKARQEVEVQSYLSSYSSKSIQVNFEMKLNGKKSATLLTTFVHVDLSSGKPVDHAEEWMQFFNEILHNN